MAKKKIGIAAGHNYHTYKKTGGKAVKKNGEVYQEHDANLNLMYKKVYRELKNNYSDVFDTIFIKDDRAGKVSDKQTLYDRINKVKISEFDLYLDGHHNWNKNTSVNGICTFVWYANSPKSKKIQDLFIDEVKKEGLETHGNGKHYSKFNSWTNLAITRETRFLPGAFMLTENGFMGGNKDFNKIFGSERERYHTRLAKCYIKAICKYFGVKYKGTSKPQIKNLYKVQTGAFESKKNAERLERVLKVKGFDTYIVKESDLYKVQVGAYNKKENALSMEKKLKNAGFDTYIPGVNNISNPNKPTIKVGSKVKIRKGAKTYEGTSLADYVYNRTYKVTQVKANRVVVEYNGVVVAAMNEKDLILI